ncbi:MAG: hypothetical protein CMA12_06700 [Euryarchaeota archaeon]|nr:hypothetical protein [Euryarchaeota archaeon]OUW22131.1 MAG: hypothetical protein CBD33_03660 [Euryarchaeota archaeon TMED173]
MPLVFSLALLILAMSLSTLLSMENSLEEGRGPQGVTLFMTIPLMVLIAALMLLMANRFGRGPKQLTADQYSIIALMMAMFIVGMLIEPAIPRLPELSDDLIGTIFLLVPTLLIALMIFPLGQKKFDEEE